MDIEMLVLGVGFLIGIAIHAAFKDIKGYQAVVILSALALGVAVTTGNAQMAMLGLDTGYFSFRTLDDQFHIL